MNVALMKTKAEQALTETFERLLPDLPGDAAMRKAAIGTFSAKGLPHRRVEEWKYTDLRAAMKEAYPPARGEAVTVSQDALDAALGARLSAVDCVRLVFTDGSFAEALSRFNGEQGSAYQADPLSRALASDRGFKWATRRPADTTDAKSDAVVALNTAFARDGAVVKVSAGASLDRPIHLVFLTSGREPSANFTRNLIEVGANARATIIESHICLDSPRVARQINTVAEIAIGAGAHLSHVKIIDGALGTHVGSSIVELAADADYRSFQFTAGSAFTRNQAFVTFGGEGGKIDLSGAFLARGSEHIDSTLVVDHAVPRCLSRELFKGVLDDRARGVFQGKIIVRPDAQKTDGKQMSQVLMLSPDTEFDSKPELEIYADDVVCGHGTTSAQLDGDLMFYCRSRGIPEAEARAMMIASFIGEALEKVEHEGVRDALRDYAERWLHNAPAQAGKQQATS